MFVGNILALTSITVASSVTVHGRALARNGAVTLDNDTFVQPTCDVTPPTTPPTTPTTLAGTSSSLPGTSSSLPGTSTTDVPSTTTTPASSTPRLPATGQPTQGLLLIALAMIGLGVGILVLNRAPKNS